MLVIEAVTENEQPKPQPNLSVRILKEVPWKRSYRVGEVFDLPIWQAKGLLKNGHAEALTMMERRKHGFLLQETRSVKTSGQEAVEVRGKGSRHYEKTTRMIPIKITRNNGKAGAFDIGTISEMPFHEAMRLVEDGWAEHLTKAERDQHGFQ